MTEPVEFTWKRFIISFLTPWRLPRTTSKIISCLSLFTVVACLVGLFIPGHVGRVLVVTGVIALGPSLVLTLIQTIIDERRARKVVREWEERESPPEP